MYPGPGGLILRGLSGLLFSDGDRSLCGVLKDGDLDLAIKVKDGDRDLCGVDGRGTVKDGDRDFCGVDVGPFGFGGAVELAPTPIP